MLAVSLALLTLPSPHDEKSKCEISFWQNFVSQNRGKNHNSWYRKMQLEPFGLNDQYFENKKVLDIGCGPLGSLEWMPVSANKICIDPIAEKYSKLGAKHHSMFYINGGAEKIPLISNSIDVVVSNNNMDHVGDYLQVFSEVKRVLKLEGVFLMTVEIKITGTACEPLVLPWTISNDLKNMGFVVLLEKHNEALLDSNSEDLFNNRPFDHTNLKPRSGWLTIQAQKKL